MITPLNKKSEKAPIFDFVEEAPQYPGGLMQLREDVRSSYFRLNNRYDSCLPTRMVIAQMVVTPLGQIKDVRLLHALRECQNCNNDLIRAIKNLPKKFKPGQHKAQAVNVKYTLPLMLQDFCKHKNKMECWQ